MGQRYPTLRAGSATSTCVSSSRRSIAALSALRLSQDPTDGFGARPIRPEALQEYRADPDRLRCGWAWVGYLEHKLQQAQKIGKKTRRKLQYSAACPTAQAVRSKQAAYWESKAAE